MQRNEITIPYNYKPRDYQIPLFKAMDSGYLRALILWHRRSGKDKSLINLVIKKMLERIGIYYYFFPTYSQGKKILWNGIDRDGFKFMDHFHKGIVDGKPNETDMLVKLKNGSIFQIIGTDKYDSIRGTNPVGCVFSEYAYQNPKAWEIMSPVLRENKGWAVFNYTPQGKNHGHKLYIMAKNNDHWFCQKLTIDDTKREDGTAVITEEDIQEERDEGKDEDFILQEYYCSFDAAIQGSYYSKQLKQAEDDGRILDITPDPNQPIETCWDLGIGDAMSIWFYQLVGKQIWFIDYYECSGEGLEYYAKYLNDLEYSYGDHYAPHDIEVRELGTGKSRFEVAAGFGINFNVVAKLDVDDGINAARAIFKDCYFDKVKCKQGLNALYNYKKEYDEKRQEYKRTPFHDWASHAADAFRYFAVSYRGRISRAIESVNDMATANQDW